MADGERGALYVYAEPGLPVPPKWVYVDGDVTCIRHVLAVKHTGWLDISFKHLLENYMAQGSTYEGLRIQGAPLTEAPVNEQGVVFMFARIQEKYGVRVEKIRSAFPDCLARRTRGGKNSIVRIEFEYKSANFNHDPKKCDWIVCWEHNWRDVPRHLRVIELRREFGLGWHVWLNPRSPGWKQMYVTDKHIRDTIPRQAQKEDLLLVYFRRPLSQIGFVSKISDIRRMDHGRFAGHSGKQDWWADTTRLCGLDCPLDLHTIKRHKGLAEAGFVRGNCQARQNVTAYWPELYGLIIEKNPSLKKVLCKYAPEKMDGQLLSDRDGCRGVVQKGKTFGR
ncbi:MAG: hypothetical protein ACOYOU_02855 [Kiritimatiellia bacterium]